MADPQEKRINQSIVQAQSELENIKKQAENLLRLVPSNIITEDIRRLASQADIQLPEAPRQITEGEVVLPTEDQVGKVQVEADVDASIRSIKTQAAAVQFGATAEERKTLEELMAEREKVGALRREQREKLSTLLTGKRMEEVFRKEFEERGGEEARKKIMELNPQIAALQADLDKLDIQEQRALEAAEKRLAPLASIEAEKMRIRREFRREKADVAVELAAKSALFQAWIGNLNAARSLAEEAAQNFASERLFQSQIISRIIDEDRDWFNSLDNEVKQFITTLRDRQEERARQETQRLNALLEQQIRAAADGIDLGWTTSQIKNAAKSQNEFIKLIGSAAKRITTKVVREELKAPSVFTIDQWADFVLNSGGDISILQTIDDREFVQDVIAEVERRKSLLTNPATTVEDFETKLNTAESTGTKVTLTPAEVVLAVMDDLQEVKNPKIILDNLRKIEPFVENFDEVMDNAEAFLESQNEAAVSAVTAPESVFAEKRKLIGKDIRIGEDILFDLFGDNIVK